MNLPKHIKTAIETNKTSLGEHPAFPPETETKFIISIVNKYFDILAEKYSEDDIETIRKDFPALLNKCKKIENENKSALEELCGNVINNLFSIPEDTIKINMELVNSIDTKSDRLIPEKTDDFGFESIEDMDYLTSEIYKRRMLNALISGASIYYSENISSYFSDLFNINDELPSMYKKMMEYNKLLLYFDKNELSDKNMDGGKVDVYISSMENKVEIKSKALFLPILIEETIKGLLELSISHGLPSNREKADYIVRKSDFKLAEIWDMRLGLPLWKRINDVIEECNVDAVELGINFIFMTIGQLKADVFNDFLREVLAKTKRGKEIMSAMLSYIRREKEKDEFDEYMLQQQDGEYQMNDNDYYEADELINDSVS